MIWSNEKIKLFNADCFDIFPQIADKSIDMILCDLPYGTTACKWDTILPFDKIWEQYERIIKPNGAIVLFGQEPFSSFLRVSNIKKYKYDWKWDKIIPTNFLNAKRQPMRIFEDIMVFNSNFYYPIMTKRDKPISGYATRSYTNSDINLDKQKRFYDEKYPINKIEIKKLKITEHPTQKPVELMEYLIKTYTNEGDLVLDNTFGSGTTAVACQNLNRHFVGMEKEKKYFDIAVQRLIA